MNSLRHASLDDIPNIEALMKLSMSQIGPRFYTPDQAKGAAQYLTIPDPTIISDGTYFVVESEGKLVGCGGWSKRKKLFTGSIDQEDLSGEFLDPGIDAAKVRAMFVHPDSARQGIGEMIFRACEEESKLAGFTRIELMATLPGVPFYLRMGCEEIEPVDVTLPDGSLLPCILMQKT